MMKQVDFKIGAISLMLFFNLSLPLAEAKDSVSNYKYVGIMTSDNLQSGAPSNFPSCPCAEIEFNGINIIECSSSGFSASPSDFVRTSGKSELPKICYDEFVPAGENRGWAHVLVFERVDNQ